MRTLNSGRMLQTLTRSSVVDVGDLVFAAVGSVQFASIAVSATVEAADWSGMQLGDITRSTDAASTTTTTTTATQSTH